MLQSISTYYLVFSILLFFVWICIYGIKHELRREMLILGIFSLFLMPFLFTLNNIDANEMTVGFRTLSFVDLLFAFSLSGIAGTIFHALFGKHYHLLPKSERPSLKDRQSYAQTWVLRFFLLFISFSWGTILLHVLFELSLPYAFLIASVIVSTYMISHRHDLLADAIWSSILTALIVFIASFIASTFTGIEIAIAPIVSSVTVLGVPADLLIWSFAAGLVLGPLYEYIRTLEVS